MAVYEVYDCQSGKVLNYCAFLTMEYAEDYVKSFFKNKIKNILRIEKTQNGELIVTGKVNNSEATLGIRERKMTK